MYAKRLPSFIPILQSRKYFQYLDEPLKCVSLVKRNVRIGLDLIHKYACQDRASAKRNNGEYIPPSGSDVPSRKTPSINFYKWSEI